MLPWLILASPYPTTPLASGFAWCFVYYFKIWLAVWVGYSTVDSDQLLAMFCCLSVWSVSLFAFSMSLTPPDTGLGWSHDTWIRRRALQFASYYYPVAVSLINNRCIASRSKLPHSTNQAKSQGWTWQQSSARLIGHFRAKSPCGNSNKIFPWFYALLTL